MNRRIGWILFLIIAFNSVALAKWKPEDKAYLDHQFESLRTQIQDVEKQITALNAQLVQVKQAQAQFQQVLALQQRKLENLEQLVNSLSLRNEEHFAGLKTSVANMLTAQEKGFSQLNKQVATQVAAQPAVQPAAPAASAPATPPPAPTLSPNTKGYVMHVRGKVLTIDLGASKGIVKGMRLGFYKVTDLNTRVGEVEVIEVGESSSQARIVSLNSGVKPKFSDVVRPE